MLKSPTLCFVGAPRGTMGKSVPQTSIYPGIGFMERQTDVKGKGVCITASVQGRALWD